MEFLKSYLNENSALSNILLTLFFLSSLFLFKYILNKALISSSIPREERRKWIITARNWMSIILMFGVILIWSSEIQAFAISLVAIAAAIAVGTKELILCFVGGVLASIQGPFKVGDRIEINDIRGDVIDMNFFTTKILEIGPHNKTHQYTGRAVVLPNAMFLTKKLINESFMDKYVLHVFTVRLNQGQDWRLAKKVMLKAAESECEEFLDNARLNMERIAEKEGLDVPSVEPRIRFSLATPEVIEMIVRIPSPASRKGNIEQLILLKYMEEFIPPIE